MSHEQKKVYLIGSLRNEKIPVIGNAIRSLGFDVFDDWFGAGPEADDKWQEYEQIRGRHYQQALEGWAAKNIFRFDQRHLDASAIGVLALPAGRSGHLEFGYLIGQRKPGFILFDQVPERWDVMVQFADGVFFRLESLCERLGTYR